MPGSFIVALCRLISESLRVDICEVQGDFLQVIRSVFCCKSVLLWYDKKFTPEGVKRDS